MKTLEKKGGITGFFMSIREIIIEDILLLSKDADKHLIDRRNTRVIFYLKNVTLFVTLIYIISFFVLMLFSVFVAIEPIATTMFLGIFLVLLFALFIFLTYNFIYYWCGIVFMILMVLASYLLVYLLMLHLRLWVIIMCNVFLLIIYTFSIVTTCCVKSVYYNTQECFFKGIIKAVSLFIFLIVYLVLKGGQPFVPWIFILCAIISSIVMYFNIFRLCYIADRLYNNHVFFNGILLAIIDINFIVFTTLCFMMGCMISLKACGIGFGIIFPWTDIPFVIIIKSDEFNAFL